MSMMVKSTHTWVIKEKTTYIHSCDILLANKKKEGSPCRLVTVAERISHFCLARNLIQPLGSTHNFTQSGWLILFSPDNLSGQHKLEKSAKHLLHSVQMSYCLLFNSSSSITPPWGKLSNLWTAGVYFS